MTSSNTSPKLTLSHATMSVNEFETTLAFYRDVLGFHVTNRGEVPGGTKMAFISQDPDNHHQIAMVEAHRDGSPRSPLVDILAFRTGSLADLRVLRDRLTAGVQPILPICHGNAWSLAFATRKAMALSVSSTHPSTSLNRSPTVSIWISRTERSMSNPQAPSSPSRSSKSMAEWRATFATWVNERECLQTEHFRTPVTAMIEH
ncbi:MAG: VOC family protein [Pseudomonadales bacterium]